jgi:hypothetical protein
MNPAIPKFILTATAAVLAWANSQIYHLSFYGLRPKSDRESAATTARSQKVESEALSAGIATGTEPAEDFTALGSTTKINWSQVESTDYKQYVKNLRALGFPEPLVRDILIADVDKLYAVREQALKPKLVPYDAPLSQRQNLAVTEEDWNRVKALWQLRVEKQGVLEQILGEYVPREILRTPVSRNYEAYEYAISQLPEEKRDAVQMAQETEILVEGMHKTSISDRSEELNAFRQSREQRDAALRAVLTPEEFEKYEMNTTPAGFELARRVIGMAPSDEEFQTMFRIAWKNWVETGGVYGRWRAVSVPREQIAAADREMDDSLKAALGPDRFLDYKMAVSTIGQQMRNFGARFELPREMIGQAFDLQTQIDRLKQIRSLPVNGPSPAEQAGQLQNQLQQLLGFQMWQNWEAGKNIRVNLDP